MTAAPPFNAYAAWAARFPAPADAVALPNPQGAGYTWRDWDRASAMLAQWLDRLALPPHSRVAVQVDRSVEALVLALAVWRCGHGLCPLHGLWPAERLAPWLQATRPRVLVCRPDRFADLSPLAFQQGVAHVFTLGADATGSLLQRAAQQPDGHPPRPVDPNAQALWPVAGPDEWRATPEGPQGGLTHAQLVTRWPTLVDVWAAFNPPDVPLEWGFGGGLDV